MMDAHTLEKPVQYTRLHFCLIQHTVNFCYLSPWPHGDYWLRHILLRRILALTQRKTLITGYRDVTSNSQLRSLYAKHCASLFSRFSLVWCKPEERRLFLLRCRFAETCFGASRHRRRNKGRSPCITANVLLVFVMSSLSKHKVGPVRLSVTREIAIAPFFCFILLFMPHEFYMNLQDMNNKLQSW